MSELLMDVNAASETYKFLNALLDDYNACKTELARGGILKAYRMLLERASGDHLKQIEKIGQLEKELADTKAKLPKTKEEITKLLHEAGFHELEECESGTWHCQISPDLSPKTYAELYKKYYGDLKPDAKDELTVPPRFDPKTDSFKDFDKVKKTCDETMAKIAIEESNSNETEVNESLDPKKQMSPGKSFTSGETYKNADDADEKTKKTKKQRSSSKSKKKSKVVS